MVKTMCIWWFAALVAGDSPRGGPRAVDGNDTPAAPAVSGQQPTDELGEQKVVRQKKRKKRSRRPKRGPLLDWRLGRWRFRLPASFELAGGYADDWRTRTVEGGLFELAVELEPQLRFRSDRFQLRLPLVHERRETPNFSLAERVYQGGVALLGRPARSFELGVDGFLRWVDRPDWPDLYQPVLDGSGGRTGELEATDRYSHFDREASGFVRWIVSRNISLKATTAYRLTSYTKDPGYDAVEEPTHLVPGDHTRWANGLKLVGRAWGKRFRYAVDARAEWFWFRNTYARDAGTGRTHADPGGLEANPRQHYLRIRVRQHNTIRLRAIGLRLKLFAAYTHNEDRFQGYYTWNQFGGGLQVDQRIVGGLSLSADYEVSYRRYTQDGYQPGPTHPPLDYDEVRSRLRHRVVGRLAYALWKRRVRPFLEVRWSMSDTNFPDYLPFVHPASRAYEIDWDYTNLALVAGLAAKL